MSENIIFSSRWVILSLLFLMVLILLGGLFYAKKQESKALPLEFVPETFREEGFNVEIFEINKDEYHSPMGYIRNGIQLEITKNDKTHGVLLVPYKSWFEASKISMEIRNRDRQWDGDFGWSELYGSTLIFVWPSDQDLCDELLSILENRFD